MAALPDVLIDSVPRRDLQRPVVDIPLEAAELEVEARAEDLSHREPRERAIRAAVVDAVAAAVAIGSRRAPSTRR